VNQATAEDRATVPAVSDSAGQGTASAPASPPPPIERQAARPLVSLRPAYPRQARLAGWEGTVVVRLLVDSEGRPADVTVISSSGYPVLDDSAVDAARKWRFAPALAGGRPTAMVHEVRIRFRLDEAVG
jgi:protein TonB